MIYSVLRVSASSNESEDYDINVIKKLREIGFVGLNQQEKFIKWGKPAVNEKFLVRIEMKIRNAGKFFLFRRVNNEWMEVYKGRIIRVEERDSESTNIFTCIPECKTFSKLFILTPKEEMAEKLEDVKVHTFSKVSSSEEFDDEVSCLDGKIVDVDVSKIRPFPDQPRKEFNREKLLQLVQSMQTLGQLKHIDLYKIPTSELTDDGCLYEISYDGQRRWEASKLVGRKTIKAVLSEHPPKDEIERFAKSFVSNIHSEPHTPYEIAKAIMYLYEKLGDVTQIHEILGYSPATIHGYLKLRYLSPDLLEKMKDSVSEEKRLRVEHAKKLSEIADFEEQEKIYNKAYSKSEEGSRAVYRRLKGLLEETKAPKRQITKRKVDSAKKVSRAIQSLISAVHEISKDEKSVRRYIITGTEESRKSFEDNIIEVEEMLPGIRKILSEYKSD